MEAIRVLIVDDHTLFREGLRERLNKEPEIEVVGEAGSGTEALALVDTLMPDIVLMDLNLKTSSGIDVTRVITTTYPHVQVLVITMAEDDSVFAAIEAGARGYLLKEASGAETVRAIIAVSHGEAIFSPAIARRITMFFNKPRSVMHPLFPELTEREREILVLVAQGYTNATIAERLVLSPKTVRNSVSNIYSKLQVVSRAEAIAQALRAGLV
jgi:DNA-binding NarL/FixJ family response regulator